MLFRSHELPAKKTIAGIKSDSSKGGNGYNEWNFEDKKGSEKITVHAQKDLDTTVLNTETRTIAEEYKGSGVTRQTTLKKGDDKLDVEMGQILHTAKLKIELKVGASKITITPMNVTIDSPTITFKAAGLFTIQGLPVKIN